MGEALPSRLCGRPFDGADVERIRSAVRAADPPLRAEIARRVCRALDWRDALGRPKLMSARVGLLRLHPPGGGLIELPAPSRGKGYACGLVRGPEPVPMVGRVGAPGGLRLEAVLEASASRLWNGLVDRYHDLGYTPLPGALLRYLNPLGRQDAGCHRLRGGSLEGGGARPLDRLGCALSRGPLGPRAQ